MRRFPATFGLILTYCVVLNLCYMFPTQAGRWVSFSLTDGWYSLLTLFTHQVAHANWPHLLGNVCFSLPFALWLEYRLGWKRYLAFYFLCGAAGGLFHALLMPGASLIGASGALFGVMMGAAALWGKSVPERLLGLSFIMLRFFGQFEHIANPGWDMVAYWGHVGGGLMGLLLAQHLFRRPLEHPKAR